MQENSHISLLFVDWQYHRRGIARQLFAYIRNRALNAGCTEITVHSSPYAVPVYQKFGFIKTGPEQELNGIRYIPMKHIL